MILRGPVITLDPAHPRAGGITLRDGLVAALDGEGGEPLPDGAVILPGFTDAHVHLLTWASSLRELALGHESLERILERVAAEAGNGFVRGFGWAFDDDAALTRERLDAVSGDTPVALLAHDYHSLWVNSAALALADAPLEVDGGVVERDADGNPTGMLREASAWAFRDRYVLPSRAEQIDALREALPVLASRGVTGVHDKDGWIDCIGVVGELRASDGELPLRIWHSTPADRMDVPGIHYVKAFMDGTLGSRTARMIGEAIAGDERSEAVGGVEVTPKEEFARIVREAAARGLPTAVHAIGDQAARDALDAFEQTREAWAGLRPRIEHAQCVHPDDVPRFAQLGVTASIQPAMTISDEAVAEREWGDRIERSYAYATLHRAGARLAGGSDAPVEALDPLQGIRAAVLRTWRPEEALDLDTALHAWTTVPAWLESREAHLAPGNAADLVILDRDPYEDLAGADVIGTIHAGDWTYRGY
jgi:predicted amidohydrolase YtcJ